MRQLKKQNNKVLLVGMVLIFLTSCGEAKKEKDNKTETVKIPESELLHKKIEEFHDEVMPEMGKLYAIEKSLQDEITNYEEGGSGKKLEQLKSESLQVKEAQDHMMEWMRAFSKEYDENAKEETKVQKLKEELNKIEKINSEMQKALELGKEL